MKPYDIGLPRSFLLTALVILPTLCLGQMGLHFGPPGNDDFPPTIPTLETNDSSVQYDYLFDGTGWWEHDDLGQSGDYSIHLVQSVSQTTTHYKTDGSQTTSSQSSYYLGEFSVDFCSPPGVHYTFTSTNCFCNFCDGSCGGPSSWFTDFPSGVGMGGGIDPGDGTDVTALETNNLSCGTVILGSSSYYTYLPPEVTLCGSAPTEIFTGSGGLVRIDLTITPDCASNMPPNFDYAAAAPSSSGFSASPNPMTPSGGSFDSSGDFNFSFNAPGGTNYSVFASTNLQNWEDIGTVAISSGGTNADFVDTNASQYPGRFYFIADLLDTTNSYLQTNLSDAYGYVSVNVTTNGFFLANPLLPDNGMNIGSLLTTVPQGTTLQLWGVTNWGPVTTFSGGSWDQPNWALMPGDGAYIRPTTNVTLQFIGQLLQGTITNFIQPGYGVRSSVVPLATDVNTLGLTNLANGDYIRKGDGTAYTNNAGSWAPSTPTLQAGEAIIIHSSTNTSWIQTYTNLTAIDSYAQSQPGIDDVSASWQDPSDASFTVDFQWDETGWSGRSRTNPVAPEGAMYELQVGTPPWPPGWIDGDVLAPVTDQSLEGGLQEEVITFPTAGWGSHDEFRIRYTDGQIYGPWSDAYSAGF